MSESSSDQTLRESLASARPFHHTAEGFRNNYPGGWQRASFWRWQQERWQQGVPQAPVGGWRFPSVHPAALPIGAYDPRWFMAASHVNPEEAVQIHLDLEAQHSVAMHWGTFVLTDEPLDEPPHRLRRALHARGIAEEDFAVMKHGETRRELGASR